MYQKYVAIGRLTKDPELRFTSTNNTAVCSFTLAINNSYNEKVEFINAIAWKKLGENVHKYQEKGSLVAIEGRLQTRDYMDEKNNVKRYVTEVVCDSVVFLGSKHDQADKPKEEKIIEPEDVPSSDLPF